MVSLRVYENFPIVSTGNKSSKKKFHNMKTEIILSSHSCSWTEYDKMIRWSPGFKKKQVSSKKICSMGKTLVHPQNIPTVGA